MMTTIITLINPRIHISNVRYCWFPDSAMTRQDDADLDCQSTINVEILLKQDDKLSTASMSTTPEQQQEISYVEKLEGLPGDAVIETLKQTDVSVSHKWDPGTPGEHSLQTSGWIRVIKQIYGDVGCWFTISRKSRSGREVSIPNGFGALPQDREKWQ